QRSRASPDRPARERFPYFLYLERRPCMGRSKTSISSQTPPVNGETPSDFPFGANTNEAAPPEPPPAEEPAAPDPFDPAALRLSQRFTAAAGVKRALISVPVRKPDKSWFVRTHPDPAYRLETAVIELKEAREVYLVAKALWAELEAEATFKKKLFVTAT